MTGILEILKLLAQLLPLLAELIRIFKGQPPEVVEDALVEIKQIAKQHCEGKTGCPSDIK